MLTGGDVVPVDCARTYLNGREGAILINGYGPTENTTFTNCYVMSAPLDESVRSLPIGRPIANTRVYILDRHNQPQPIGVPGELCIAGDGLARGYLNQPELTQEKFVADPFVPGARMYRSGDQARWLADGNVEFLGRRDTQVKIRGFRIEMGEIEARLNQHAGIKDSVVVAQGDQGNRQLVAFYVADDHATVPTSELRSHLLATMPGYMVPAAFESLPTIPLNPNGKVDRRALAQMEVTIEANADSVAPRNESERTLAAIWADVLKLSPETIGITDNFFELGGNSLVATQLVGRIRTRMGIDLPLTAVFASATIAELAGLIVATATSAVPAIQPVDRTQIERLPLSFVQERLWFIDQLQPGSVGYNVPLALSIRGDVDADQVEQAMNLIIARHESLRTVFASDEGQPRQQILDQVAIALDRIDASGDAGKVASICETEAATPFDLANGPLVRGKVVRSSAAR
jgi:acyl carrier protein